MTNELKEAMDALKRPAINWSDSPVAIMESLDERNKALASMLGEALECLDECNRQAANRQEEVLPEVCFAGALEMHTGAAIKSITKQIGEEL